jgi:hypothetical protein
MAEEEIRQRVKESLLKRDIGDELTVQEETILAYAYYAAGEQAVRMWVGSDIEQLKGFANRRVAYASGNHGKTVESV